jgi:hypothetical protein
MCGCSCGALGCSPEFEATHSILPPGTRSFARFLSGPPGSRRPATDTLGHARKNEYQYPTRGFAIPLSNIGLGAAKNVVISWAFPFDDLTEKINRLARSHSIPAQFSFKNGWFKVKSETIGPFAQNWNYELTKYIDYVLPSAVAPEGTALYLPPAYILATSALLYVTFSGNSKVKSLEIPALKVTFRYQDIADGKHKTSFDIDLSLIHFSVVGSVVNACLQAKKR